MRDALNATGRPNFFAVWGGGDQFLVAGLPVDISYYATDPRGAGNPGNAWQITPDVI